MRPAFKFDAHPAPSAAAPAPAGIFELPIERTGRWNVPLREVGVRPYPFPFTAAFSLANENTFARADQFEALHTFVCGRGASPFGDGLGLEITDSLPAGGSGNDGCQGMTERRARELCEAGWFDQIYCPSGSGEDAERLLEALPADIRPTTLIGSVPAASRRRLVALGVEYHSDDDDIEEDKFGDHWDHKIAERFHMAAGAYDWRAALTETADAPQSAKIDAMVARMN